MLDCRFKQCIYKGTVNHSSWMLAFVFSKKDFFCSCCFRSHIDDKTATISAVAKLSSYFRTANIQTSAISSDFYQCRLHQKNLPSVNQSLSGVHARIGSLSKILKSFQKNRWYNGLYSHASNTSKEFSRATRNPKE